MFTAPPLGLRRRRARSGGEAGAPRRRGILAAPMDHGLSDFITREYQKLRRLAQGMMRGERVDHTLTPTAVVHEAMMRMSGEGAPPVDTAQFGTFAATAIRRVLVDHARRRSRFKRGGGSATDAGDPDQLPDSLPVADILAIDEALTELQGFDPDSARIVELRFFAGLSIEEVAAMVGASESTVARQWRVARAFLHSRLGGDA